MKNFISEYECEKNRLYLVCERRHHSEKVSRRKRDVAIAEDLNA